MGEMDGMGWDGMGMDGTGLDGMGDKCPCFYDVVDVGRVV
jgi:hypothetical protein